MTRDQARTEILRITGHAITPQMLKELLGVLDAYATAENAAILRRRKEIEQARTDIGGGRSAAATPVPARWRWGRRRQREPGTCSHRRAAPARADDATATP